MNIEERFALRGRNPDVLTCIANLSNDEVFTPPEFANRMLDTVSAAWAADHDGADIWTNRTVKFLDPCTKSGVFLREITKRLIAGLESEIPDIQERVDHILTQQVYGIGSTLLTSLMARRSVYCSKFANGPHSVTRRFNNDIGNIWFQRTEHTWTPQDKCKYCGASKATLDRGEDRESHAYAFIHTDNIKTRIAELFGADMQFDVVIGNPPYQLGDGGGGGGASATPIYNLFVEAALKLEPRYTIMITPSRWFSGGKGLDDFRDTMLKDGRFISLIDYPQLYDVFPGVKIRGGVSYWVWGRDHRGGCEVKTMISDQTVGQPVVRKLDSYDVLIRRNEAVLILDKVTAFRNNGVPEDKLGNTVSARKPFGLTNQKGKSSPVGISDPVLVYSNQATGYMARAEVPNNHGWIDKWKVLLVKAHGTSGRDDVTILGKPIVAGPDTACTETYLIISLFDNKEEAENLAIYMRTKFVRFLVSLRKITQNITRDTYNFVPNLPMNQIWTDAALYQRYKLTAEEIAFIEAQIAPHDRELFDPAEEEIDVDD